MNKYKENINKYIDAKLKINPRDKTQTSEVLMRFTNWSARSRVYKLHYDKGSSIRVKCDLTKHHQEVLQLSRDLIKNNNLHGYVYANGECRLTLKDSYTGKRHFFDGYREFEQLARILVTTTASEMHHPAVNTGVQAPHG